MDEAIIKFLVDDFKSREGVDLSKDKNAYIRLKDAAEKAKIELSSTMSTDISLPYITATQDGPKHLNYTLTRSKFEELIEPIVNRCKVPLDKALEAGKLSKSDITKIILVGGPTRIPMVKKFVEDYFGRKAEGGVDPMECVAIGASIQGAVLSGEIKDIVLLDVTPLTLGIETLGGVTTPIIPANTTIPTKKSQVFTTAADMQTAVTIHIVQGERPMAADNVSLGMFNLVGIPPAPRGIPQIEVTFDIDANGILHVSAVDKGSGKSQSISISATNKLSKEEIEKMKKQAEEFAEQDRKKKEEVEKINAAETLSYTIEKTINEAGNKIDEAAKKDIQEDLKQFKEAISKKDIAKIDELSEKLSKKIQDIGAKMYQTQDATGSAGAEQQTEQTSGTGQASDEGKTVDADFKEK
jgi:molecular chaperone DnaK